MIKHFSTAKLIGTVIAIIQLFDIAIRAATDQLEPLRVASNVMVDGQCYYGHRELVGFSNLLTRGTSRC